MVLRVIEGRVVLAPLGQFFLLLQVGDLAEDQLKEPRKQDVIRAPRSAAIALMRRKQRLFNYRAPEH